MGLRSRKRRLVSASLSSDEKLAQSMDKLERDTDRATLEEHLQAARRDQDAFNASWTAFLRFLCVIMALYLVGTLGKSLLLYPSAFLFSVPCQSLSVVTVAGLRSYLKSGRGQSVLVSLTLAGIGAWLVSYIFVGSFIFPGLRVVLWEIPPIAALFVVLALLSVKAMGQFSAAEVDRAAQIAKLEKELHRQDVVEFQQKSAVIG